MAVVKGCNKGQVIQSLIQYVSCNVSCPNEMYMKKGPENNNFTHFSSLTQVLNNSHQAKYS
jgi:hypothetical protein